MHTITLLYHLSDGKAPAFAYMYCYAFPLSVMTDHDEYLVFTVNYNPQ